MMFINWYKREMSLEEDNKNKQNMQKQEQQEEPYQPIFTAKVIDN